MARLLGRESGGAAPRKKRSVKKRIAFAVKIAAAVLLVAGVVLFVRFKMGRKEQTVEAQTTSLVGVGSFDVVITGSGTVQPIESYTFSPLIEGKILECPFNKGDMVEEGDLLYRFEDSEAQSKIKAAQSTLNSAQRGVESAEKSVVKAEQRIEDAKEEIADIEERMKKLTITASVSGMVEELDVKVGDSVSGTLCKILDYNDISVTVAFNAVQYAALEKGDRATVGIPQLMTTVGGSVEKKYTAPHAGANGTIMYSVKIAVDEGVSLAAGTTASVTVHTDSGDVTAPTSGTIAYSDPQNVAAEEAGEITALLTEEGDYVEKGEVIAYLKSESLETELENAREALEDAKDDLEDVKAARDNQYDSVEAARSELESVMKAAEDYVITSPISGVILEKNYKTGDTYSSDSSEKTLMVVADMSQMVFTMNIDELDIANIVQGQSVNVYADALPGEMMSGVITSLSNVGNSESGVTGYPIEITIDDPMDLMSGMNVTAEIVAGSVVDAIVAPASAIFMVDGMYYATKVETDEAGVETDVQVQVSVGLANGEFYEITDGLSEGDVIRDSGIISTSDDMYYY